MRPFYPLEHFCPLGFSPQAKRLLSNNYQLITNNSQKFYASHNRYPTKNFFQKYLVYFVNLFIFASTKGNNALFTLLNKNNECTEH